MNLQMSRTRRGDEERLGVGGRAGEDRFRKNNGEGGIEKQKSWVNNSWRYI